MTLFQLTFISLFTLLGPRAFAQVKPIFYLYDIANQTQEDIATILGPQSSLNAADAKAAICANCQKYSYQNDRITIEYTNDMADRITIRLPTGIEAKQVPALLGLPDAKPDFSGIDKMQWNCYAGIRELIAFLGRDREVRLILVKVITN